MDLLIEHKYSVDRETHSRVESFCGFLSCVALTILKRKVTFVLSLWNTPNSVVLCLPSITLVSVRGRTSFVGRREGVNDFQGMKNYLEVPIEKTCKKVSSRREKTNKHVGRK